MWLLSFSGVLAHMDLSGTVLDRYWIDVVCVCVCVCVCYLTAMLRLLAISSFIIRIMMI